MLDTNPINCTFMFLRSCDSVGGGDLALQELQAQLDDAVPRSKVERMQSELKAEMRKLESEMARRVDPVEVTRLIERAKGPLQSHIFSVQEQIKIKIAKLEDELANSVNAKALYALQDELKVSGAPCSYRNVSSELKHCEAIPVADIGFVILGLKNTCVCAEPGTSNRILQV